MPSTSASTTFSAKIKLDHVIHTTNSSTLYPIQYSRTVAAGQPIVNAFKIESYSTESAKGITIPTQAVGSFQEYIAGCTIHERCLGHLCTTPRGTILLPQKLASTLGVMSNDYSKMAEVLFARDTQSQELVYRERLRSLMLGKSGKMRGDMPSGPVDGSARMVISQCWELEEMSMEAKQSGRDITYFAVPKMMARNMRVLRTTRDKDTGIVLNSYDEDELREGDYAMVVRAPSLWAGNDQPMVVVLWEHECFGLSPSKADEFHADFDGDEMHLYFLGEMESIEECKLWKSLSDNKFKIAIDTIRFPPSAYKAEMSLIKNFMVHSTVSIKELMDGCKLPELSKVSRVKDDMANTFVERLRSPNKVFEEFSKESIRGIKDVMAQQLRQGFLGDMSRQARLSASCIQYRGNGVFHIRTGAQTIKSLKYPEIQDVVNDLRFPLGGNSCMRAVSQICAKAQQAALDSHRVSRSISSKLDLINNFIVGGTESLVAFSPGPLPIHSWKLVTPNTIYCIVNNEDVKSFAIRVVAAYNPTVLKTVKLLNGNIREVCKKGIIMVCNYYDIKLTLLEICSLTELLCYRPEVSPDPITTKSGIMSREMRWMTVVFANHYGVLKSIQRGNKTSKYVFPETITDAASFCNFDYI